MAKKRRSLSQDLVEIAIAAPLAGAAIGIVGNSGLPVPIARGTQSLIGVKLIQGAAKTLEKRSRRLF